jgi:NAD-dependent histone deacetylase SIR2
MDCGKEVPGAEIMKDVLSCKVPQCLPCVQKAKALEASRPVTRPKPPAKPKKKKGKKSSNWDDEDSEDDMHPEKLEKIVGVMKPSITFFGEKLHSTFVIA